MDIDLSMLKELVTEVVVVKNTKLENYIGDLNLEDVDKTNENSANDMVDIYDVFNTQTNETTKEINIENIFKHENLITTDLLKKMVFDRQLKSELSNKVNKYQKNLYASHISNECIRAVLFSYFGLTEFKLKTNFKSVFYTLYGDIIQNVIEVLVGFTEKKCKLSKEITDKLKINAEIDGVYYNKKDNSTVITEIKTINDLNINENFYGRDNDWLQVMYYLYLSLQYQKKIENTKLLNNVPNIVIASQVYDFLLSNTDINYVQLWYIGREFEIKCITTKVDINNPTFVKYIEYFMEREKEIVNYVNSFVIPDLSHKFINKTKCVFCLYKDYCHTNVSELNINNNKELYNRLKNQEV